jgi:hypothetical protein
MPQTVAFNIYSHAAHPTLVVGPIYDKCRPHKQYEFPLQKEMGRTILNVYRGTMLECYNGPQKGIYTVKFFVETESNSVRTIVAKHSFVVDQEHPNYLQMAIPIFDDKCTNAKGFQFSYKDCSAGNEIEQTFYFLRYFSN